MLWWMRRKRRRIPRDKISLRQEEDMVIKSINLETVCGITSTLPDNDRPEVAFAGKSNVGKSSMINALMNRKSYARISATPGKTQTINFYNINDALYLVDLRVMDMREFLRKRRHSGAG